MRKITVTNEGADNLGLTPLLQRYADEFWIPDHVSDEQAGQMILDSFRRKVTGELRLIEVRVVTDA